MASNKRRAIENDTPRAVIVDQLTSFDFGYKNSSFIDDATRSLGGAGFKIDIYRGTDATTANIYKKILASNCSVVIFRPHQNRGISPCRPAYLQVNILGKPLLLFLRYGQRSAG